MLWVDVSEKFTDTCLEYYGLDPCRYFSSPGLSWDAMLKNDWNRIRTLHWHALFDY